METRFDPGETPQPDATLSAQQLADLASISIVRLTALVERGLVEPARADGSEFTPAAAIRVRRMMRLRADLGVSYVGAAIIVDLLERIDRLERR